MSSAIKGHGRGARVVCLNIGLGDSEIRSKRTSFQQRSTSVLLPMRRCNGSSFDPPVRVGRCTSMGEIERGVCLISRRPSVRPCHPFYYRSYCIKDDGLPCPVVPCGTELGQRSEIRGRGGGRLRAAMLVGLRSLPGHCCQFTATLVTYKVVPCTNIIHV